MMSRGEEAYVDDLVELAQAQIQLIEQQRARIEELEAVLPEAQLVLRLSDSPDHLGESSMQFERALMRLNEAVNHPQQHTIRAMTQGTFDEPEQPKPAAP